MSRTPRLAGVGVGDRISIGSGVFEVVPERRKIVELTHGVTREFVQSKTGVPLH